MAHFVTVAPTSEILELFSDESGYAQPPHSAILISDDDAAVLKAGVAGYTLNAGVVSYVKPLALAQSEQTAIIEAAYQSANTAPITYNGWTFQADADSVALMAQVATALPSGVSITWYDSTNVGITLDDVQFAELRGAILMRGQPLFAKKQTLKAAIRAATTVAQVEAVTW